MDLQFDRFKQGIVDLPAQFEISQASQFEDAMFVYLDEELQAPGIHQNSDFRLGVETRTFLFKLGFPEPSSQTTWRVAEAVLVPMVYETFVRTYGDRAKAFEDPDERRISAQVEARRTLFPKKPEYYCENAWQLGLLRWKECWEYR